MNKLEAMKERLLADDSPIREITRAVNIYNEEERRSHDPEQQQSAYAMGHWAIQKMTDIADDYWNCGGGDEEKEALTTLCAVAEATIEWIQAEDGWNGMPSGISWETFDALELRAVTAADRLRAVVAPLLEGAE